MFYTLKESALPHNTSHDALRGQLGAALKLDHGVSADSWSSKGPWVMDTFPSHVVYQHDGQTYKRGYSVDHGPAGSTPKVTLKGERTKVHTAYVDNKNPSVESQSVFLDVPTLKEAVTVTVDESEKADKQVRESATLDESVVIKEGKGPSSIPVKLIAPGWGSMAYYSKEVLQRDGPSVFKKGTHMMWNHATNTEEADRPEGDLSNLAAVLTKDANWQDSGALGPGLYSEAKVFSDYATQVAEKGPHIGISINAGIKCHEGQVDGRTGKIADKFVYAYSTDFVTKAGAGGAPIVPVLESAGAHKEDTMTDAEAKAHLDAMKAKEKENSDLLDRIKVMEAEQNRRTAIDAVTAVLKEGEIPFTVGLLARACANPTMKEGKPDPKWIESVIADFSEGITGKVVGAGGVKETTTKEASKKEQEAVDALLKESLTALGVPEAGMASAMKGR